jgi:hypothetical protein
MEKIKNNIDNSDKELEEFEEDLVQPNKEEPKENINDKEEKK